MEEGDGESESEWDEDVLVFGSVLYRLLVFSASWLSYHALVTFVHGKA